jgi:spoIIIJ-associated protein
MQEQTIKELIQEMLEKLGVQAESIEFAALSAHPMVVIRTDDSKRLIGPQGDHLRAFNHILRRLAEKRYPDEDTHFMVDVNGYHLGRIRDLEQKARLLADRVRTFRSSAEMTPMNAYERMVIHAMFSEDPEVTTESEGIGKTRHIVLKYRQA